jgi:hypothetical protein
MKIDRPGASSIKLLGLCFCTIKMDRELGLAFTG